MLEIARHGPADAPADAEALSVPLRDGVLLAADLYRSGPEPRPVILVRLPYDKDGPYCFMPDIARYFRDRGYHVVVQDVRGKYRSEGATEFGLHEPGDGHDTVEWIAGRPWCDGSVVMWGDSYYGYTTLAAASAAPPALKAIAPRLTGSQLSTVLDHGDGTRDVEQTARKMYFASHYVDAGRYEWEPDWSRRPLLGMFEEFFERIGTRSAGFDAEFDGPSPFVPPPRKALLEAPPLPVLYTVGWFDNCAVWSWHDVRALAAHPGWAPGLRLRIEAVDHENYRLSDAPVVPADDHTTSVRARERMLPRYLDPALEFFDAVLGGGLDALPRVRFEVGHDGWREASAWPPAGAEELTYYLSDGMLTAAPPTAERIAGWVHDPADLVPSASPNPFAALFDRPDLGPAGLRDDVLRFTGPAADRDTDLIGSVALDLRPRTPAGAHLHARLLDQAPDGTAHQIAKGQARLADPRDGQETTLDLLETAYRLRAGHRLVLDVTSSDFPDYIAEAPPGADPWTATPGAPSPRALVLGGTPAARLRIGPKETP